MPLDLRILMILLPVKNNPVTHHVTSSESPYLEGSQAFFG